MENSDKDAVIECVCHSLACLRQSARELALGIERYSNELALAKRRERPREMGRERVERPTETRKKKKKREKKESSAYSDVVEEKACAFMEIPNHKNL